VRFNAELVLLCLTLSALLLGCATTGSGPDPSGAPINRVTAEGFVRDWLVVGGFPNREVEPAEEGGISRDGYERDFLAPVGGEAAGVLPADDTIPYEDADGQPAEAVPFAFSAAADGLVDLSEAFAHGEDQVAYAYCRVAADGPERVTAYFGSDDSARVYVNGEQVHSVWTPGRGAVRWTESFPVDLRNGMNDVLVKVEQRVGGWGFYLELYRDSDMAVARLSRIDSVALKAPSLILPARTLAVTGTIEPEPADEPIDLPCHVTLHGAGGGMLGAFDVRTCRPLSLSLPAGLEGYVEARYSVDVEGREPLTGDARFYVGDYAADKAALLEKAHAAAAHLRDQLQDPDPEVQRAAQRQLPIARLGEEWLGWDPEPLDGKQLEVFATMRPAIEAMARGEDYQLEHPGSLPALLDLPDGMSMPGMTFWVSLPKGYESGGPWPVIIHLHGSGGRHPWTPNTAHPHEGALYNYKFGVPMPYICITPATNARWDTDVLDLLLDHVLEVYNADRDRVSLTGFSMGGFATYAWATRRPERFAALAVLAGAARNNDLSRIAHIPIWICHGERDGAVSVEGARAAGAELERLGADVRYTWHPDLGHGIQASHQHTEEFWAWLASYKHTEAPE
jgi:pimeloyl-ACP methyl ester carboxylesterase